MPPEIPVTVELNFEVREVIDVNDKSNVNHEKQNSGKAAQLTSRVLVISGFQL